MIGVYVRRRRLVVLYDQHAHPPRVPNLIYLDRLVPLT